MHLVYHGVNLGEEEQFKDEIQRLQEIADLYYSPSPVDMAICSFMPLETELTVPIRDGIYPKCIVYVRPSNGRSGAGDYYLERDPAEDLRFAMMSLNPGVHYRTLARWPTVSNLDWYPYERFFGYTGSLGAEVVIQIRNDVTVRNTPDIQINSYPWDQEIEVMLAKYNRAKEFFGGMEEARKSFSL